jgi:pilus assembly protein CpaE
VSHRIVLAIDEPEVARRAAALADETPDVELVEEVSDLGRLPRVLRRDQPDVVILHDRTGTVPTFEQVRELAAAFPEVGIIALVGEQGPDLLRAAMHAGARDVLGLPLLLDDFEASIRAAATLSQQVREHVGGEHDASGGRAGRIVAIAGAKGGVGTTTIATHLALTALSAGRRPAVCLVDFDLGAGDVRTYLDTPHRRSIADLIDVAGELSQRHLAETLFTHESGLRVLFAPLEGEEAENVGVTVARNVLGALRTRHDLVVVDCGAGVSNASAVAVELAELGVLVTTPDMPSLRGAQRVLALWDRVQVAPTDTRVLVNRQSRRMEVQREIVRRVTDRDVVKATIPADFAALVDAANTGAPDRLEDRAMRRALRDVAQELELIPSGRAARARTAAADDADPADNDDVPTPAGGTAEAPRKTSLLSRLAGERGQVSVEAMGLLPVIAVVGLLMWQIALIGYTFILAGHAAREGARALATGEEGADAVREDVPGAWRSGLRCKIEDDRVKVSLAVPALVPGLPTPVRVPSSAGTTVEDDPASGPAAEDDRFTVQSKAKDPCQKKAA